MFENWPKDLKKKIILPKDLKERCDEIKKKYRLVSINGSFDLMHAGHLYILYEAKSKGEALLVALNTDLSIQGYKSKNRPIIPLKYRLEMMAALQCVDYVTWFDELNPLKILSLIKPHVHVNGSEYGRDCIEADLIKRQGGALHIVGLRDGLSTSSVIRKIKDTCV